MGWWHAVRSRLRRRPGVLLGAVVVVLLLGAAQLTPEGRGIEASGLGRTGGTTDQATGSAAPPDLGGSPEPSGTPLSQVTPSESPSPTDTPTTPPPTSAPAQTRGTASVPATAPAAQQPPTAPAASTTTPPRTTVSGAWPGPTNTGVPAGTTLKAARGLAVTTPGAVLDGLDISGEVDIKAPGVVIRNSKIHGDGTGTGVDVYSGDVTIEDSEIYGFENAIGYGGWTAYRVNIHSTTADGVKLGTDTTLQDSWIHDLTPGDGAHADGGQVQDGITNLVVRHNTFDLSTVVNSVLFIQPIFGPSTAGPILVEGNYLSGGGFTVFVLDGGEQYLISNITFRDNVFARKAQYGPGLVCVPVTWTGNTWADTGATLPKPSC